MRCIYCFAHQGNYGNENALMNFNIAKQAVDKYLNYVPKDSDAYIIFFGGEPLMAYDTIVETVNYIQNNHQSSNYKFHLVTNGVFLTNEIIDFLADNNFGVAVSIDGGEKIQNIQRPLANGKDSFYESTKNLKYLFRKIENVHVRGTYWDYSQSMVDIYQDLLSIGFKEISLPPDILDITNNFKKDRLLRELDDLHQFIVDYSNSSSIFPFGDFTTHIRRLFIPKLNTDDTCGLGFSIFSVIPNGDIFPCHRFCSVPESKLGNVLEEKPLQSVHIPETAGCRECWNPFPCPHGCKFNDYSINKKNTNWCIYSKKMTEICLSLCSELPEQTLLNILTLKREQIYS